MLEASPAGAADELKKVLDSVGGGGDGSEGRGEPPRACKEGGEPLNATEQALADTMECLSLAKIVGLMKAASRETGLQMPRLGSVVQVSAQDDRFVGKHSDELFALLKGLSRENGGGDGGGGFGAGGEFTCERRDITGGHISTLFRRGEAIVPAIVAAFEKLGSGGGDIAKMAPASAPAPAPAPVRT